MNAYPVVCSTDIQASKRFYTALFGFQPVFEVDFYVHLIDGNGAQLGFVQADHESVPAGWRGPAAGVFITLETDDVDSLYERARAMALEIVWDLRDEEWGQRHFMVRDPDNLLVDVVKHNPPTQEFLRQHGLTAGAT